jgi:hypothetical protein
MSSSEAMDEVPDRSALVQLLARAILVKSDDRTPPIKLI